MKWVARFYFIRVCLKILKEKTKLGGNVPKCLLPSHIKNSLIISCMPLKNPNLFPLIRLPWLPPSDFLVLCNCSKPERTICLLVLFKNAEGNLNTKPRKKQPPNQILPPTHRQYEQLLFPLRVQELFCAQLDISCVAWWLLREAVPDSSKQMMKLLNHFASYFLLKHELQARVVLESCLVTTTGTSSSVIKTKHSLTSAFRCLQTCEGLICED